MDENELKEFLLKENEDFKKLYQEHQSCDKKLKTLMAKGFLTGEDELKVKELKKRKLALKDRMYLMMAEFRKSKPVAR
ncbi:MAG: YdcH family protein [Clostridiales bacterium]|nr:YdcH family protein [Clostridiales bacterium]